MKKIKNFKTVLGVVIVGLTTLLPSCVQGDFSDLYDEELVWSNGIPRTKSGTDPGSNSPDRAFFADNECAAWSLCHLYSTTYYETDYITENVKDIIVEQILIAYKVEITEKMRVNGLRFSDEYKKICNKGVAASLIPSIAYGCGLGEYNKTDMPQTERSQNVVLFLNSLNNFAVGDVLVRTIENGTAHVWILKSKTISNGKIQCQDNKNTTFLVDINVVVGFFNK